MKLGKVSDTILSRSVLKPLNTVRGQKVTRMDIGQDVSEVDIREQGVDKTLLSATDCGYMPLIKAVNNIYAAGGTPIAASDCIVMPEQAREIRIREVIAGLTRQAAVTEVPIAGGHTTVSASVSEPVVTVTVQGLREDNRNVIEAGQHIIAAGCIGISGVKQLVETDEQAVYERYSKDWVSKAVGEDTDMYIGGMVQLLRDNGINCYMHDVSEGGIFGALWDMCEYGNVGLDVDIRSIPVRQEIIEICELFNVNPYELQSLGCLLMTADNDCDIINILNSNNIPAAVIGRIVNGNQRILHNKDEERFLTLPNQDEIFSCIKTAQ